MNQHGKEEVDISFVVTVSEKVCEMEELYEAFNSQMVSLGRTAEFIFVQNVAYEKAWVALREMAKRYPHCRAIRVRSVFTESDCLNIGIDHARGRYIVTVPIYYQVDPRDIGGMLEPLLTNEVDLTMAARTQRKDSLLNRWESKVYNGLIRKITGTNAHDLGAGVVAMTAETAKSLDMYGDFFRFIPILAERRGNRVREVQVRHIARRKKSGVYAAGAYLRRLLDILTIFFIIKFTKKPLRFFGLIGAFSFLLSLITGTWLVIEKLSGEAIGNRPLLVLCALLAVLGIQLFSIGLIGEIIIFTHARGMKEYHIDSCAP